MQYIDVFNGDADGICALLQIRRSHPKQSKLVTGIKRDINSQSRVDAKSGDHITVLDISFEKNVNDVIRLLDNGASIDYFDHHKTGNLIQHNNLFTDINLAADTCTSLIIDKRLNGQYRAWALTAAFGDNLSEVAMSLGRQSGFTVNELATLKQPGILLNSLPHAA
jgi:oligoribonuclease NrnB/cAMP/cGMP phosphodiesterase (DHH superfamily)